MNRNQAQVREMLSDEHFLAHAIRYIREHYSDDLTLERVAATVPISPSYLSHIFRLQHGQSFLEFLTNARVDAAKCLLEQSSLTVTEIGFQVGYQDPSYFGRVFKRITGVTPSDHRRHASARP